MAITAHAYGLFLESLVEGRINVADQMFAMLVTNSYVFNQNTHKFKSVVNGEVTGSGYTAGGLQVTGITPSYSGSTKTLTIPGGSVNWPAVTVSGVVGAVLYMAPAGLGDALKPLVGYVNLGQSVTRSAQQLLLTFPPALITLGPVG